MSDTLFGGEPSDQNANPPNPPAPTPPSLPAELQGLVGEGKKYATVEAAMASLPHKEQHIARLETELAEMREKAGRGEALEETYASVQDLLKELKATPKASSLDEAGVASLLDRKMEEREQQRVAAANGDSVKRALTEKFGEKAQEVYKAKASELGIGESFLTDLARKSPKAALELFGLTAPKPAATPSSGTIATERFNQRPAPRQTRSVMGGGTTAELLDAWRAAKPE